MVALIPHYIRLSKRFLGILRSIMIDQTNTTKSESVGDFWSMRSSYDLLRNVVEITDNRLTT